MRSTLAFTPPADPELGLALAEVMETCEPGVYSTTW